MARMQGSIRHALDTVPPPARSRAKVRARLSPEGVIRVLAERRPVVDSVSLSFPMPPSANNAWRNTENAKGRVRSDTYIHWVETCCTVLSDARIGRVEGPFAVLIDARRPKGAKGALRDVDNLIKPTLDVLKNTGMTADDRHCQEVTARWAEERGEGGIIVVIRTWTKTWENDHG